MNSSSVPPNMEASCILLLMSAVAKHYRIAEIHIIELKASEAQAKDMSHTRYLPHDELLNTCNSVLSTTEIPRPAK